MERVWCSIRVSDAVSSEPRIGWVNARFLATIEEPDPRNTSSAEEPTNPPSGAPETVGRFVPLSALLPLHDRVPEGWFIGMPLPDSRSPTLSDHWELIYGGPISLFPQQLADVSTDRVSTERIREMAAELDAVRSAEYVATAALAMSFCLMLIFLALTYISIINKRGAYLIICISMVIASSIFGFLGFKFRDHLQSRHSLLNAYSITQCAERLSLDVYTIIAAGGLQNITVSSEREHIEEFFRSENIYWGQLKDIIEIRSNQPDIFIETLEMVFGLGGQLNGMFRLSQENAQTGLDLSVDILSSPRIGAMNKIINYINNGLASCIYIPSNIEENISIGEVINIGNNGNLVLPVSLAEIAASPRFNIYDLSVAERLFSAAAAQGSAFAQVRLGQLAEGNSTAERRYAEALRWYILASQQQLPEADFLLSLYYMNGVGVPRDEVQAHRLLERAASQGLVEALIAVALNRQLVNPSYSRTVEHELRRAARQQVAQAELALAVQLSHEDRAQDGTEEAYQLLERAADRGLASAQTVLAVQILLDRDRTDRLAEARVWLERAASQEHAMAQTTLAALVKDEDESRYFELIRRAADNGQSSAQYMLAIHYALGDLVEQDTRTALALAEAALENGSSDANLIIAWAAYNERNYQLAANSLRAASQPNLRAAIQQQLETYPLDDAFVRWMMVSNHPDGTNALRSAYLGLLIAHTQTGPESPNYRTAAQQIREGAEEHYDFAQYVLGIFYLEGLGVEQDTEEALYWLMRSAEQGYIISRYKLGELYLEGEVVPADYALATFYFGSISTVEDGGLFQERLDLEVQRSRAAD
ncbi:MAG TPA: hypothetical protein DF715_11810 [Oceanicaulis sp.]|nr:hypothetical protein [Oceanicaulis sp.]